MKKLINPELQKGMFRPSFDVVRVICVSLIIMIEFGLNVVPYFSYVQPFLYFAQGTLFTIYGYIVLRDGADLRKNIKHALKIFLIMLFVYGVLTLGYYYITTGNPLSAFTKRNIFEFAVLNIWSTPIGASIWYIQSVLYSLIIFWLFRKLKKFDWLFCIVFFIIAILLGEFAGLINFNVNIYFYIPGNFLTRTMPYMLLGRLIHNHINKITDIMRVHPLSYFALGLILSAVEFFALGYSGNLIYPNHFIGFILMSASLCILCVLYPRGGIFGYLFNKFNPSIYKGMFFTFNPLGYTAMIVASFLCRTDEQYSLVKDLLGISVLVITFVVFWFVAFLKKKFESYDNYIEEGEANETEI